MSVPSSANLSSRKSFHFDSLLHFNTCVSNYHAAVKGAYELDDWNERKELMVGKMEGFIQELRDQYLPYWGEMCIPSLICHLRGGAEWIQLQGDIAHISPPGMLRFKHQEPNGVSETFLLRSFDEENLKAKFDDVIMTYRIHLKHQMYELLGRGVAGPESLAQALVDVVLDPLFPLEGGETDELNLRRLELQQGVFRQILQERAPPAVFEKILHWFQERFVDNPSRIAIFRSSCPRLAEAENGQEPPRLSALYTSLQVSMNQAARYSSDPLSRALFAEILFEIR